MKYKIISILLTCLCMLLFFVVVSQKQEIDILKNPETMIIDMSSKKLDPHYLKRIEENTRLEYLYLSNVSYKELDWIAAIDKPLLEVVIQSDDLLMSGKAFIYFTTKVQRLKIYANHFGCIEKVEQLSNLRLDELIIEAPSLSGVENFFQIQSIKNLVIKTNSTIDISGMKYPDLEEAAFLDCEILGIENIKTEKSKVKFFK